MKQKNRLYSGLEELISLREGIQVEFFRFTRLLGGADFPSTVLVAGLPSDETVQRRLSNLRPT